MARTPVRRALRAESDLVALVVDGLGAVSAADRGCIEESLRASFADSVDLDAALNARYPQDARWDYILGHGSTGVLLGLEPHSAEDDEIRTVVLKRKAAIVQLRPHLREGARVVAWFWVASGRVQFASTERARFRLDQAGVTFVGRVLQARHLPMVGEAGEQRASRRSPRRTDGTQHRGR